MIERYSITCSAQKIQKRFSVDVPDFYKPHYNAAPTQLLPVITNTSSQGLSLFYWGIPPEMAKNKTVSEKIVNLKMENLKEKAALKRALLKRRCMIPADGFYAWKKVGKKTHIPYRFVMPENEPFAIAGIWEDFEDEKGVEHHTFMMLTLEANETVSEITDRMPLVLGEEAEKIWLSEHSDEGMLSNQLKLAPLAGLACYTVSPGINTSTLDVPSMIIPTPPADQHGNLTLFD